MEAVITRDEELETFGQHVRGVTGDNITRGDILALNTHYAGDMFQAASDYEAARRSLSDSGPPAPYIIVMALLEGRPGDFE